jgi:aspartate kinase
LVQPAYEAEPSCVRYARRFRVSVHVRSSLSHREGTGVTDQPYGVPRADSETDQLHAPEGTVVQQSINSGVAHDRSEAETTVIGVPDKPRKAAEIFEAVAAAGINLDTVRLMRVLRRGPASTVAVQAPLGRAQVR